jgi:hypothetical protein
MGGRPCMSLANEAKKQRGLDGRFLLFDPKPREERRLGQLSPGSQSGSRYCRTIHKPGMPRQVAKNTSGLEETSNA